MHDVALMMLVVRIMLLFCAYFYEELIPTLIKMLWTTVRDNAPKVWRWLREQWPIVRQFLTQAWSHVRQYLTQHWGHVRQYLVEQWLATERGQSETPVQRARSPSPDGRHSSQHVEPETHGLLLLTNGEMQNADRNRKIALRKNAERSAETKRKNAERSPGITLHIPVASLSNPTASIRDPWMTDMANTAAAQAGNMQMVVYQPEKRKRDEGLPDEPERERKKQRT